MGREKFVTCAITKQQKRSYDVVPISNIRPGVLNLIKVQYPDLPQDGYISKEIAAKFRREYIEDVLQMEKGELSKLDKEVLESIAQEQIISENTENEYDKKITFGDKLSDRIASFGGSWAFIISFGLVLFGWIAINGYALSGRAFDPFPFILLNLVLSTIAALQAPVIMMSQNRKEEKDRLRSENDYQVNLKAELEIKHLHEKLDNLTQHQWQRLLEIQQLQVDLMEEKPTKKKKSR